MTPDSIDAMNAAWRDCRPDLDPSPLELVGRVLVIARYLEQSVERKLKPLALSLGQFDILATLRRRPDGQGMTPKMLMHAVMLSSGGMTNRLDRLEKAGLVRREADPDDRRGVVVALTAKGRKVIDRATELRFAEAAESAPELAEGERAVVVGVLRDWLAGLQKG